MSIFELATPNPRGYRDLTADKLPLPPHGFRLVDVREPSEFSGELGHIPGAELVPLSGVTGRAIDWDKKVPLVLVCRSGGRSGNAAQALVQLGFQQVMNLTGGMLHWNAVGLPVEK
jgi:rhodanese-related sulfurtransferase